MNGARRFQFRLRHAFVLMTVTAFGCGLVTWLGPAGLVLACAPFVTWIALNRTNGECPWLAVLLGASVQALLVTSVLAIMEVLFALQSEWWPRLIFLGSITVGVLAGVFGIFVSIPTLALWFTIRGIRRKMFEHDSILAPEPSEPAP